MKSLLTWYDKISKKSLEDIIEFHVRFEKIHPFQDRNKNFYIRGIREYQTSNEKGYLIDTCLNSQDNYEKLVKYFLENDEN